MRFTVCESENPPVRSLIEGNYIPWYSNVDTSSEWQQYAAGLGGFTLPMICVIDPANPDNYLDRSTGVQYANEFYQRLQGHIPVSYTLTVTKTGNGSGSVSSSPAGISCGAGCSSDNASFNDGTVVSLQATADSGSLFTGWSGGGCSGTGSCTVSMSGDQTVSANFSREGKIRSIAPILTPLLD